MLEYYFKYPRVLSRLRDGKLGDELDRIADYLFKNNYKRASAKAYLSRLARLSAFLSHTDHVRPITAAAIISFLGEYETVSSRIAASTAIALARRVVPECFEQLLPEPDPHGVLLTAYADYLIHVRGLEEKTQEGLLLAARRILVWWDDHNTGLLSAMRGTDVLALVEYLMTFSVSERTRSAMGSSIRRFLKFLRWADLNDHNLARFVPRVPCYRLAHLPPRLAWQDVRRAVDAIDTTTAIGVRNRAIILLFATTGIRNKELRSLVLDDIRWRDAHVQIRRTKGRRDRIVPLMQEAGKALADYVLQARPGCDSRRVFLQHLPPVRPIDESAVISRIVRSALARAGVVLEGPSGAHLIRHSLATQLVSQRQPINEVADLLGHRSIDTTAIYVKVALPQLVDVALPFPGGA